MALAAEVVMPLLRVLLPLLLVSSLSWPARAQANCDSVTRESSYHSLRPAFFLRPLLPKGANVRFIVPLSSSDTLVGYELGDDELSPGATVLIVRDSKAVYHLRTVDLDRAFSRHDPWFEDSRLTWVIHQCSKDADLTYLLFQAGNAGGWAVALTRSTKGEFAVASLGIMGDGRLEVSSVDPRQVRTWTELEGCEALDSHGAPKHYQVTTWFWNGGKFDRVSRIKTGRCYSPFLDDPVRVRNRTFVAPAAK